MNLMEAVSRVFKSSMEFSILTHELQGVMMRVGQMVTEGQDNLRKLAKDEQVDGVTRYCEWLGDCLEELNRIARTHKGQLESMLDRFKAEQPQ